jgi:hypothetical protein
MSVIFEVQSQDISELTDLKLTKLLKMLLHLEARTFGIAQREVDVALNIRVADGGEDGRIQWDGGPDKTDYLPSCFVQFQNKATKMAPAACANEVVDRHGEVKAMVDDALCNGAAYILFTTQELNKEQKDDRIEAIRGKFRELGKDYADTVYIDVYDASKIQGWTNHYIPAITAVLNWTGRTLVDGLQTWSSWERYEENHLFEYVADSERSAAITSLREVLAEPRKSTRIIGLSGLGKTRLAFEICRGNSEGDEFRDRVAYIDAAFGIPNLPGVVASWVQRGLDGLLVVDNCDLQTHKHLKREVEHADSRLSILTLHYNPEKDGETDPISLTAMDDASIKSMLEPVYGERIVDLDRVVAFAQGFPQMAVLLAKARLDQSQDMGSLTDDDLVSKMLWGGGEKDDASESILQGCALFDKFGFEEEASVESRFIAENVIGTDEDALYRCIKRFEKRGVFNSVGRYSQIIPKPLAIRLAADWWRCTRRRRQEELIGTAMPGQLEDSFCVQISKLDFLPQVKVLTADLCGEQGPFGQAEVILSTRGSRLFRALVEVNPSATSDALFRAIHSLPSDELVSISGDVRRNLVRALEKLCYHKDCFVKSARSLLMLASEENESWSNNATGQFLQLFKVFLSGTAAAPVERLKLIDEACQSHSDAIRELAVKALESAIDTYGGSRMVGAEYQGSGAPLKEWRPKIWQEAFDYWIAAIERLGNIAIEDRSESDLAKRALARHIRGLMHKGRDVMLALDGVINKIADTHGPLWPEALDSIKHSLSYDSKGMPEEGVAKLHEWVVRLTPDKLEDKLKLFVSIPSFEHEKEDNGHYVDIAAMNAEKLAKEISGQQEYLLPYLSVILEGGQRQAYIFGKALIEASRIWEPLLTEVIQYVSSSQNPNDSFLRGILAGIYSLDETQWDQIISRFSSTPALVRFYPSSVTTGKITAKHLERILVLIENGLLKEGAVTTLVYGRALSDLPPDIVSSFTVRLSQYSDHAAWGALDILAMYCHGDPGEQKGCEYAFKDVLLRLTLNKGSHKKQLDMHYWMEAAKRILETGDNEFAVQLMDRIVESTNSDLDYGDIQHYIKPIVRQMLENFSSEAWPILGRAIVAADSVQQYRLSTILDSDDHFERGSLSVLASLPDELLREWCEKEPEIGPRFVARATETFVENEAGYQLSPRAKYLIDVFGDSDDLLSELSANMASFGRSGSVVPYYEKEIDALTHLLEHEKQSVRDWADRKITYLKQRIEIEQVRDAEERLGIR